MTAKMAQNKQELKDIKLRCDKYIQEINNVRNILVQGMLVIRCHRLGFSRFFLRSSQKFWENHKYKDIQKIVFYFYTLATKLAPPGGEN